MKKGMQAYLDQYDQASAVESDEALEEFQLKAAAIEEPLQAPSTVKGLLENDLRTAIPPQLFSAMSGIINMMAQLEGEKEVDHERPHEGSKVVRNVRGAVDDQDEGKR